MRPRFLNRDEFAQVVRNTPLVAIDLIVRNPDQRVLVGLRTNEPAKGKWFVPGGVVRKYERLADAFARIVKAEVGLKASINDAFAARQRRGAADCGEYRQAAGAFAEAFRLGWGRLAQPK